MDKHLLEQIEECRKELIALSDNNKLTSKIVVETSKKLDDLLNEYQSIDPKE
ncbi:aspartyl-phosphate phosphatase Spo0E family protein [Ornithinibacillus halotolerans]|uniref:Aspartyl-phosphate phosphatase Spo0E family protein n=1 Tax=Ornithinibacillus halotolerans TaxID=1274357 RepID=A0A916W9A8_9BACI|nr:aspartyl-phosphate phosphatase Spo0E family protein [Ornithinibacillus halotolerans]GGA78747.1 hypothetical protein GCM10008025_22830 [Ornithinibacillus halotolerans]